MNRKKESGGMMLAEASLTLSGFLGPHGNQTKSVCLLKIFLSMPQIRANKSMRDDERPKKTQPKNKHK